MKWRARFHHLDASMLPSDDRLLLGPGPSPVSPRVQAAMTAPPRSHLDPDLVQILDDIRARLARVFRVPDGSLVLAVSGTGTSAMEAAVANLTQPGTRALAIVTGYFGDRLATMLARYGATVERLDAEWGRAIDPALVRNALGRARYDLVSIVHAETSTGVLNPLQDIAREAAAHDALVIADTVTSLGAVPLDMRAWSVDVCYSCSQKGLGAPSGLSPLALSPRALERRVASRSFAFDVSLLEDFWVRRKYHHTISAPLVYALATALEEVEEEGLEARWSRHERVHRQLVDRLASLGLGLLPPATERLWNLNTVAVPDGVNEAAVRRCLLSKEGIEIGAGLGPLAGRVWRIGLMGSGATSQNVDRLVSALPNALDAGRQ
jgi:alanine-glyoxylate transaminase / serine-glyoxylate transaminase / serine-pyruvate transaminase